MDIHSAAMRFLEHRMRTEKEMAERLRKKEFSQDEIDEEIQALKTARYIDDAAYAKEYIRYQAEKGKALSAIKYEMRQKGISHDDIRQGIFDYEDEYEIDLEEDEEKRAERVAEKMMTAEIVSEKTVAKLSRKLKRLGYSADIIYRVSGHYMNLIDKSDLID